MKKIMMINDFCNNCGDCVRACQEKNKVARIMIYEKDKKYLPIVCQHCAAAPCKEVCPVEAIYFKDGYVYLDEETCIGCGLCAIACPFGAITMDDKAYKCILCNGEEPVCVKACSKNSLALVDLTDIVMKRREDILDIFKKLKVDYKHREKNVINAVTIPAKIDIE